jgi:hypothetical protein
MFANPRIYSEAGLYQFGQYLAGNWLTTGSKVQYKPENRPLTNKKLKLALEAV